MTYEEFCYFEDKAWKAFLKVFEDAGVNRNKLYNALDSKDCINFVSDACISVVVLDEEEDD